MSTDLSNILDKVPEELRDLAERYLPELLKMTQAELTAWLGVVLDGDYEGAYAALLERMDTDKAIAEGEKVEAHWKAQNTAEAERRAFFKKMCLDLLSVLLALAAASVTL
ncbi:MAG TPA: hypothetical protein VMY35_10505 [Phycisphaerae bacterium]|nr:hypothetical protein [Phycisphaerae bacterium]